MSDFSSLRLLTLPGWQGSSPEHWQTRWEELHSCERLQQSDWEWPLRGDWMSRLDEVVQSDPRPHVLIAHSLSCQLVAAWAAHSTYTDRIHAALLVAPADTEREDMPPHLFNWRPIHRIKLPFPSSVVTSADDPCCSPERGAHMAEHWGSTLQPLGALGHINAQSKLGDWPQGWALLQALLGDRRESIGW